jgi:asparagine synthase (glutamine-hydrolysing)
MCGLTGLLRPSPSDDIIGQVAKMTAQLGPRGPEDEGVWSKDGIRLGHRRLAILRWRAMPAQPIMKVQK